MYTIKGYEIWIDEETGDYKVSPYEKTIARAITYEKAQKIKKALEEQLEEGDTEYTWYIDIEIIKE